MHQPVETYDESDVKQKPKKDTSNYCKNCLRALKNDTPCNKCKPASQQCLNYQLRKPCAKVSKYRQKVKK
jgi:hypothetical protein